MRHIIIVTKVEDFPSSIDSVPVVSAKTYLTDPVFTSDKDLWIHNLCRSYKYQSSGYYVSLLAEARGHKVWPSVSTLQDFRSLSVIKAMSDDLDYLIRKSLRRISSEEFTLSIYFGQNTASQHNQLARALFGLFEAPMLRVTFERGKRGWDIQSVKPISLREIPPNHLPTLEKSAREFFSKRVPYRKSRRPPRPSLAILVDPQEAAPPSDEKAIERFMRAADQVGMDPEIITREDYQDIPDYDALFIRSTTSVTNFTYKFARRAWADGLVVIDDPLSIVRCTNKVFLAELLERNRLPRPETLVIHRDNADLIHAKLGFPVILKQPDSSFSQGVVRVSDSAELQRKLGEFLGASDFVVAQKYMPTDFDWRVGVMDRRPLFACRYYMARGHWQIYNWSAPEGQQAGRWDTMLVEDAPHEIIKTAVKAANLIGDGFYGVDLKMTERGPVIIEINDNPSIESDVEDMVLKDRLYEEIMLSMFSRVLRRNPIFSLDLLPEPMRSGGADLPQT